jgi:hypothetical protein
MNVDELEELSEFSRLCFFIDGVKDTPPVPCLLRYQRSGGLEVEAPLIPAELGLRAPWMDDTDVVPTSCMLQSYEGNVALHGVRAIRIRHGHSQFGRLDLAARFAVIGANGLAPSGSPQLVRSQIEGLHEWLEWGEVERVVKTDDRGRVKHVSIELTARDPETISYGDFDFRWEYSWRLREDDEERRAMHIPQRTFFTTSHKSGVGHDHHLNFHRSLRDLLMLCYWGRRDFRTHEQLHQDDPDIALAGNSLGPEWRPLLSALTLIDSGEEPSPDARFPAFLFHDLGCEGFLRWLAIRGRYARGYDPIISHLARRQSSPQEAILSLSIGIEAIAYQRALDTGLGERAARQASFRSRLDMLTSLGEGTFRSLVGGRTDVWAAAFAEAYNGVKHANRELPPIG